MANLLSLGRVNKENRYISSKGTLFLIFADCGLVPCAVVNANRLNSEKLSCRVPVSLGDQLPVFFKTRVCSHCCFPSVITGFLGRERGFPTAVVAQQMVLL